MLIDIHHGVIIIFSSPCEESFHKGKNVKLIIAIIQPTKLSAVREALEKIEVTRLTITDAQGFGRQRGRTEMYRGHEYTTKLLRKSVLEIVVNDDFLERTVKTIISVARTGPEGNIGDGKIFIVPVDQAMQIESGARGPGAV
jgi:nitrogen regulatory protein P-II 2